MLQRRGSNARPDLCVHQRISPPRISAKTLGPTPHPHVPLLPVMPREPPISMALLGLHTRHATPYALDHEPRPELAAVPPSRGPQLRAPAPTPTPLPQLTAAASRHACALELGHEGRDLGVLEPHQLLQLAHLGLQDLRTGPQQGAAGCTLWMLLRCWKAGRVGGVWRP